jgi:integrase
MTVSRDNDTGLFRYHFQAAGQRYTHRGFPTIRAARKAEAGRRHELECGRSAAFKTFADLAKAYLAEKNRTASAAWAEQLQWKLNKRCGRWAMMRPEQIGPAHVAKLLQDVADAGNGPRSVNEYRRILHAVFEYGVKMEALMRNPVSKVDRVGEPVEPLRPIPTEDLRKLLLAANPALRNQLVVSAMTGSRWVELTRLTREDLYLDQEPPYCVLRSRKKRGGGERPRKQYLPPSAADALRGQIDGTFEGAADAVRVFPGPRGTQKHHAAVKRLHRACLRAGIPEYGFHRIRYWTGSQAVTFGVSNKVIAKFLGHTTTAVTERYMHLEDPLLVDLAGSLEESLGIKPTGAGPGAVLVKTK